MHRSVRRASHKMKAFVRFRLVEGTDAYVAWFEPSHDIVERTAPFFARRFASMRWSILTPYRCAHWDGEPLAFTEGLTRADAPAEDVLEDLWRTYYANIFNPARLNGRAMRAEMPIKYWQNLPEARVIAELRASAPARVRAMLAQVHAPPESMPGELAWQGKESAPPLSRTMPVTAPIATLLEQPGYDPVYDPGMRVAREREQAVRSADTCRAVIGDNSHRFRGGGMDRPFNPGG